MSRSIKPRRLRDNDEAIGKYERATRRPLERWTEIAKRIPKTTKGARQHLRERVQKLGMILHQAREEAVDTELAIEGPGQERTTMKKSRQRRDLIGEAMSETRTRGINCPSTRQAWIRALGREHEYMKKERQQEENVRMKMVGKNITNRSLCTTL